MPGTPVAERLLLLSPCLLCPQVKQYEELMAKNGQYVVKASQPQRLHSCSASAGRAGGAGLQRCCAASSGAQKPPPLRLPLAGQGGGGQAAQAVRVHAARAVREKAGKSLQSTVVAPPRCLLAPRGLALPASSRPGTVQAGSSLAGSLPRLLPRRIPETVSACKSEAAAVQGKWRSWRDMPTTEASGGWGCRAGGWKSRCADFAWSAAADDCTVNSLFDSPSI